MTRCDKAVVALLIVSSVSAELSVLVSGKPHYDSKAELEQTGNDDLQAKRESWDEDGSWDDSYLDAGSRGEYSHLLGIDPLVNTYVGDMGFNEGNDKHMVRKRVLPFSEERILVAANPDALDLMKTKESLDR